MLTTSLLTFYLKPCKTIKDLLCLYNVIKAPEQICLMVIGYSFGLIELARSTKVQ